MLRGHVIPPRTAEVHEDVRVGYSRISGAAWFESEQSNAGSLRIRFVDQPMVSKTVSPQPFVGGGQRLNCIAARCRWSLRDGCDRLRNPALKLSVNLADLFHEVTGHTEQPNRRALVFRGSSARLTSRRYFIQQFRAKRGII